MVQRFWWALLATSVFAQDRCREVFVSVEGVLPRGGTLERAERMATTMFVSAGVKLRWRPAADIRLRFVHNERGRPGALAYALPYANRGADITVMVERVRDLAGSELRFEDALLAHVLVHEITHVLQGIAHHSAVGVMRPRWDNSDYFQMRGRGLPFTAADVERIHAGMEYRLTRFSPDLSQVVGR